MRVLDLFSGIGGFSLGLERAGMRTVAFCEIEPFCRAVLRKHWPDLPIYEDIRTLTADRLRADGIAIDAICGGFPCQDISVAGKGAGIEGKRSSLWKDYARLIGELRPRYVIVENVAALLRRGIERVLGDLATLRYDAEWHCIPASAVGAPHRRDRLWIVAYRIGAGLEGYAGNGADSKKQGRFDQEANGSVGESGLCADVADTEEPNIRPGLCADESSRFWGRRFGDGCGEIGKWWFVESDVGRVASRVSSRVDRLRALGNAVVPQVVEIIGKTIMAQNAE